MKILSSEIVRTEKWVKVEVIHNGEKIHFSVYTVDGKVGGTYANNFKWKGNYTPSNNSMKKHFNLVKEHIEKTYK